LKLNPLHIELSVLQLKQRIIFKLFKQNVLILWFKVKWHLRNYQKDNLSYLIDQNLVMYNHHIKNNLTIQVYKQQDIPNPVNQN